MEQNFSNEAFISSLKSWGVNTPTVNYKHLWIGIAIGVFACAGTVLVIYKIQNTKDNNVKHLHQF